MTDVALPPRIEAASTGARIDLVDVARGVAILAMVVFHFTWDLSLNGLIALNPQADPAWQWFARLIAGTFLGLVGVSLVLSTRRGLRWEKFFRRLGLIVAGAILVSAVTALLWWFGMLPAFVYFGILHAIALFSLAAIPFLRLPVVVVALAAAVCFAAPFFLTSAVFNAWPLVWIGLSERVPLAVDYVPFFPWFGATLTGIVFARLALAWRADVWWARWSAADPVSRFLVTAGRWSLVIYLVHQPVLFALTAAVAATPPGFELRVAREVRLCEASCQRMGDGAEFCTTYCGCVFGGLREEGILARVIGGSLTDAERQVMGNVTLQCQFPPVPVAPPPASARDPAPAAPLAPALPAP